jgi:hypothetical protein
MLQSPLLLDDMIKIQLDEFLLKQTKEHLPHESKQREPEIQYEIYEQRYKKKLSEPDTT